MAKKLRGRALLSCLAAVAALMLVACEDDPARSDPPAELEAVAPAQFAAYASTSTNVFVRVLDGDGDPVRGAVVHWRVLEGSGTVAADSSASDELGVAGTTWTMGTAVGETARLEAFIPGVDPAVFSATPALPPTALITTRGGGQTAAANTPLADPLVVRVTLPDGRPLAGVPVLWTGPAVRNGVPQTAPVPQQTSTDAQGEARAALVVPQRAGAYEVTARVGTEPQVTAARIPFTVVHGPVAQVHPLTSPGGCAVPGGSAGPLWGLLLMDLYNNPVQGERVDFQATADGSVAPATAPTDAQGGATTNWTARGTRVFQDTMFARVPSIGYSITFLKHMCQG